MTWSHQKMIISFKYFKLYIFLEYIFYQILIEIRSGPERIQKFYYTLGPFSQVVRFRPIWPSTDVRQKLPREFSGFSQIRTLSLSVFTFQKNPYLKSLHCAWKCCISFFKLSHEITIRGSVQTTWTEFWAILTLF